MRSEYLPTDWEQFDKNYRELTKKDNTLKEENNNEDYLWDTYKMSSKIKNNMVMTNGDHDFHIALNPCTYMARKFKFVEDENIKNLLYRFYRYDECNYNAEIFGTKIIDLCNKYCCSYIFTIFWALCENDNNFKELFFVPTGHLFKLGFKMKWARLDENGELHYIEPTKTYSFEEDKNELLEILKQIEENANA